MRHIIPAKMMRVIAVTVMETATQFHVKGQPYHAREYKAVDDCDPKPAMEHTTIGTVAPGTNNATWVERWKATDASGNVRQLDLTVKVKKS